MPIYGVPIVGAVYLEATSPEAAFTQAQEWAESVMKNSFLEEPEPILVDLEFVVLKAKDDNVKDATEMIQGMHDEAEAMLRMEAQTTDI